MKTVHLQQGDVALERICKLPSNLTPVKADKRGIVLAEGEQTGHHHRIEYQFTPLVELLEAKDGTRFLVNKGDKPVSLVHEEHQPITIEPGIYEVGSIYEVDHLAQMERKVID